MKKDNKVMLVSMLVNSGLSLIKIIFGFIGNSSALVADGLHSISDLSTDLIAIVGNKLACKPADDKHPDGHGRLEYLTSILIGLVVLFLGFGIIYNSTNKEIIIPEIIVSIVTVFTIISKLLLARFISKKGREYKNNILIASGKESFADVISSIVVLVSSLLMMLTNVNKIFGYADTVATIIVGIFIVKTGFSVLKDNLSIILGEQETDQEYMDEIRSIFLQEKEVIRIDKINILKFGPYYKLIGEVSMNGKISLNEAHNVLDKIEKNIANFDDKNKYITIHINPYKRTK